MQADYDRRLQATIERYQDEMTQRLSGLESEYEARAVVLQQADRPTSESSSPPPSAPSPAEDSLKQQYEARLREAARRLQQAYEQQLKQKLQVATQTLQADYEQRLAQKIEHYQDQLAQRSAQLEEAYEARLQALSMGQPEAASQAPARSDPETLATFKQQLQQEYDQKLSQQLEQYHQRLTQRIDDLEHDYANRLMQLTQRPNPMTPTTSPEAESSPPPPALNDSADLDDILKTQSWGESDETLDLEDPNSPE
ncbi:uncharacterized protein XM38_047950 [Halomicronema hongdechloris C2206]|uniref:Uncharacterized protein n=1 Tax=Halomicronema hongdechloris C2206 TaxID=1641165 RepID=A0A1Z3HU76_9CYAN|nr:hypothetical protein [Halomicronema hongdechloris]ASC73822.1 uncharacterized protein XM38_047950 [Halomicronema hongdechloris C2206]